MARLEEAAEENARKAERLQHELEQTQLELAARVVELDSKKGVMGAGQSQDKAGSEGLRSRLSELEARLAEYEIIEDDIADLSHFKEENARLHKEIEALKQALAARESAAPISVAPPDVAIATPAPAVAASEGLYEPPPESQALSADPFLLSQDDDILKQFAAAVNEPMGAKDGEPELGAEPMEIARAVDVAVEIDPSIQSVPIDSDQEIAPLLDGPVGSPSASVEAVDADPLNAPVDTDKMLAEASGMAESEEADGLPLEGALDAEKLLKEASAFDEALSQDDLLGEFKDDKKGGKA